MKYNIIYADPPWSYSDKGCSGNAAEQYDLMTTEAIASMLVPGIAAKDSVLFMWATWPKLEDAFKIIKGWGFTYKTCAFVWVKTNRNSNPAQFMMRGGDVMDTFNGLGRWTRGNTEFVLLATRGKGLRRLSSSVRQLVFSPLRKHSQKPDEVRDRIVQLVGDLPRVELFARNRTAGWDVFGNQVEGGISL